MSLQRAIDLTIALTCITLLVLASTWPVHAMGQPANLKDTGLDSPEVIAFTPQYPLWSDGTSKRRWLYLPPGTSIDASRAEAWDFPPGTKAWKEFAYDQRIETRLIERLADGSWRYATYAWNPQGTQALLAPAEGIRARNIPSRSDCLACHEGAPVPILGFSAVQLSGKIPASTPTARAALGYLHGNCGHCHNASGPLADVSVHFAQPGPVRLPGDPNLVIAKMRARNPLMRMPPLGVTQPDAEGIALVERWIRSEVSTTVSTTQEEHRP
jgi:hypothetical protein